MRVLLAFVILLAGIGAVAANLAEPRRYKTEMTPLSQSEGRIAHFSPGNTANAAPAVSQFDTTVQTAEAGPATPDVPEFVTTQNSSPEQTSALDSATKAALARDIQTELARLGCYAGPIDGNWSPEAQRAAGSFVTEANARIPVGEPDLALFSLAKSARENAACGPAITTAQAPAIPPPAMGLGGPGMEVRAAKTASYRVDREVDSLFTNPLGR